MRKPRVSRAAKRPEPYPTTLAERLNLTYPDNDWRSPNYKGPPTVEELNRREAAAARRGQPRAARQPERCIVSYHHHETARRAVPMLRLRGKWLEALGIHIGCGVRITGRPGQLVIDVVSPPAPGASGAQAPHPQQMWEAPTWQ
ncbi:MAG TPA: SymE family type I addiction module toxin [Stenotrophomonas sp.]|nr:SymE family type I addiction module toxin [Stenotrophomonas sp.]